ncbi:MAG: type II toxin-antitoxin system MqsA family antitoxin [Gammaproteobacteria bacterium]|nr:type II toxin-antitoxin system MqsA family antitoxin [Gammaproteobacteria bacterium]
MNTKQHMNESTTNAVATAFACPQCGESAISTSIQRDKFVYGTGNSAVELTVELPVRHCNDCDIHYLDSEAEDIKHEAVCRHLGVLPPAAIVNIRKKHSLSRAAFAKITGLGEASLGRWEKGINIQNIGNDRYIRLLEDPRVMQQLREVTMSAESRPLQRKSNVLPFRKLEITKEVLQRKAGFRLRPAA